MANKRVLLFSWRVMQGEIVCSTCGHDIASLNQYLGEQDGALTASQIIDWLVANKYYKQIPTPTELGMAFARSPLFKKYNKHYWCASRKGHLWKPVSENEIIEHIISKKGFTKNIPVYFKRKARMVEWEENKGVLKEHS